MSIEDLKVLGDELNAARQDMQKKAKDALQKAFKSIFDEFPEVHAITWTQFAPHFNDGEACIFGVNEPHFVSKEVYENDNVSGYGYYDHSLAHCSTYRKDKDEPINKACRALYDFMQSNEDTMQAAFGDDSEVTVTREGVDISDFSDQHD